MSARIHTKPARTRALRWLLRVAAASLMVAGLTGPAPGNIGGCGGGVSVADPIEHCRQEGFWRCRRDNFAGRTDQAGFEACLAPVEGRCEGTNWPAQCQPTPGQTSACIERLMAGETVHLTNAELDAMFSACDLCQ